MRISVFVFLLFLVSCNNGNDEVAVEEEKLFVSEKIIIEDAKPELESFPVRIMEKLKICTTLDTVLSLPPCDAEYFRIFEYMPEKNVKDGFMVEMVPGLFNTPVHQLVIIREMEGEYKIVNQYLGLLLEMRTTIEGFNDLLIGYNDPDIGMVAIRHEWQGNKYEPVDVEEINDHFVKPEMKDSINAIFLPAFSAGH